MSFEEKKFPGHKGVNLHYMEKIIYDETLTPVLIVPALPESAIDYKDILFLLENRAIAITHRGREQSDAPETGYSLQDHGEDIARAIDHFELSKVVIVAYSRGVPYFFQILPKIIEKIKGVILIDYPAEYPAHELTWPAKFLNKNWRAMPNKDRFPKPWVLTKIQQESVETDLWHNVKLLIKIPVLLMIGGRSYLDPFLIRSKVTDDHLTKYKEIIPPINVIEFDNSGHDLRLWEYDKFIDSIREFLRKIDPPKERNLDPTNKNINHNNANKDTLVSKIKKIITRSPGIEKEKIIKLN